MPISIFSLATGQFSTHCIQRPLQYSFIVRCMRHVHNTARQILSFACGSTLACGISHYFWFFDQSTGYTRVSPSHVSPRFPLSLQAASITHISFLFDHHHPLSPASPRPPVHMLAGAWLARLPTAGEGSDCTPCRERQRGRQGQEEVTPTRNITLREACIQASTRACSRSLSPTT